MTTLKLNHPEAKFIEELQSLPKGDLFVDLGANAGYYAINLADCYREVWAVEPCKVFVEQLKQNIDRFKITNITVITKAVSDKSGFAEFYGNMYVSSGRDNPSLKTGLNLSFEGRHKHFPLHMGQVETVTLTELVGDRNVDLIKVDTEGNEKDVLWGSQKIMHQIKAWHIEIHDWNDTPEIKGLLEFYGFKIKDRGMDWRNRGWLLAQK